MQTTKERISNLLKNENVDQVKQEISQKGFFLLKNAYTPDFCKHAIELIDQLEPKEVIENKPFEEFEVNYSGSELRIWKAHEKDPLFKSFYDESISLLDNVIEKKLNPKNLLAIRNKSLESENQQDLKGRWHLDSFRTQYKVFLFLSDVTEESGPFEFIPGTNKVLFKLKGLLGQEYIDIKDASPLKNRKYQSLDESFIKRLAEEGYHSTPVLCPAGTLMIVDTSNIHRARPCLSKSRYVLTTYFE